MPLSPIVLFAGFAAPLALDAGGVSALFGMGRGIQHTDGPFAVLTVDHFMGYQAIGTHMVPDKKRQELLQGANRHTTGKGNLSQQNKCRTQCREGLQSALGRIRQAAAGDIARELVEKVRNSVSVDWTVR